VVYFLLEQFDPSDLTDTHTHYKTSPIALSCSGHNLLSRGEHNVPGHFISGMFWQITDLHHDPKYSILGNKYNSCHQAASADGTKPEDNPGMFGDPRCEAPWSLVKSAIKAMKDTHPNPDFVLWTG
jgi:hypothetical protein